MKDQNYFKEKLFNHTIPVREDIWKNIEATLPVQRRRLPFLWLSLAGFLLLGAATIGLSLSHKTLINKENQENILPQDLKTTSKEKEALKAIASNTSENIIKESKMHENANLPSSNKIQKATFKHKTIANTFTQHELQSSDAYVINSAELNRDLIDVDALQSLSINAVHASSESVNMSSIKPDPSCYRFRGKNGKNALSIDVFAGPGFATRKFDSTEGSTSPYATARNQTEKNKYAWGAGARINLNLQQGFAVRLGISIEQIGDVFNYTDPAATQQHMVTDSFFAADGTFLYSQVSTVTILGTLIKKIHNRYTHLDIPLLLSYELPMGRSTLMINAGPVLNLTSIVRGQILDPSLNPVHITPGEPDELQAYKNNLGVSLYLGAGALFPITDNISALVEPRLLYRINPVTLDSYPLKERRSTACLNLGIRYHFN